MIAPMKKAFIILQENTKASSLKTLRSLGILHVEPLTGKGFIYDEIVATKNKIVEAIGVLSSFKTEQTTRILSKEEGIALADEVLKYDADFKKAMEDYSVAVREYERVAMWGDFEPALLKELKEKGVSIRLGNISKKKLSVIPQDIDFIVLATEKDNCYVAVINADNIVLPVDFLEFKVSEKSLSQLKADLTETKARATEAQKNLSEKASMHKALTPVLESVERDVNFETIRSGMDIVDEKLAWFSAWVPTKEAKKVEEAAQKNGWGLLLDDPLDEELPPTKVENNAFVRCIQPMFDFLGTVPNYREYDISVWFLLFFSLFFAMIFGDGGYGTLLFVGSLVLAIKSLIQKKPVGDFIKLMLVLTSVTIVWGALSGSWFGLPLDKLPPVFNKMAYYPISSLNPDSANNIKYFCFVIGLIQMCIAHIKNVVKNFPSPKIIGDIGSLLLLIGMFFVVLNLVISSTQYPIPSFSIPFIGVGFGLNFIFCNYNGKKFSFSAIGKSLLESLGNIVSMLLGVVNAFADITSYIRLWAVGLAGMAISQTVNNMIGPLFSKALFFAIGLVLIVFGHGLNLAMSVLSVIVHGVRLNFLEFSTHLGMEWSGYKYDPFRNTVSIEVEQDEMERSI